MRDYNIRTPAAVVLYDTSNRCTYSSLEPLVPGAAYLVPGAAHASTQQTIQIRGTGFVSRVKTPCEQTTSFHVRATSRATLKRRRRRRSAVSPWKVDPLRSTTLRGIRSARSFRSSALPRKSCHSVSVMLEKRGGRCRTDGPIRVLSCQMRHTIAAIKAAWCRSLC